jgi:hypothetical protein
LTAAGTAGDHGPLFDRNWPASGGGYFRLLPYALSRWLLQKVNQLDGQPAIFYFHPWEIDAAQPRIAGISAKTRFRHYVNLQYTEGRREATCSPISAGGEWMRCFSVPISAAPVVRR